LAFYNSARVKRPVPGQEPGLSRALKVCLQRGSRGIERLATVSGRWCLLKGRKEKHSPVAHPRTRTENALGRPQKQKRPWIAPGPFLRIHMGWLMGLEPTTTRITI
jgi:hypothetical protein